MLIETSFTEILLLIWAVAASGIATHYYNEERKSKFLLRAFIEDEKVRDQVLRSYADFKAKHGG